MPLVNIILHENFKFERIPDSDHEVVRSELEKIGCFNVVSQNGVEKRLLRDSYYGETATRPEIEAAFEAIKKKLDRKVRMQLTVGETYAYDLESVSAPYTALSSLIGTVPSIPVAPGPSFANVFGNFLKEPGPNAPTDTSFWTSLFGTTAPAIPDTLGKSLAEVLGTSQRTTVPTTSTDASHWTSLFAGKN